MNKKVTEFRQMKAVILAGGLGTRMQELTELVPKPMVEIGGMPVLWHIMKIYSSFGVNEFFVALGYKSYIVKNFFVDYRQRVNSISVDLTSGETNQLTHDHEGWRVNLVETGAHAQTGARIKKLQDYIGNHPFFLTYGDGVANVDLSELLAFHQAHSGVGTVTAVQPPSKFGALGLKADDSVVSQFTEKPADGDTLINGGFFVFEPEVFEYVSSDDDCIFEREPLEKLSRDGKLHAYTHRGFWQCMDTVKDVEYLNELWRAKRAPWRIWQ